MTVAKPGSVGWGRDAVALLALVCVAACAVEDEPDKKAEAPLPPAAESTEPETPPLPPVALPLYAVGDSYAFDNPPEIWTITGFDEKGRIQWRSSLGAERVTSVDPLLPSLRHATPEGRAVARIIHREQDLFPLRPGQAVSFSEAIGLDQPPFTQSFSWSCAVGKPERTDVPAGQFETYPVACDRSDGLRVTSFYAPQVGYVIRRTLIMKDKPIEERRLTAFFKGGIPQTPSSQVASAPVLSPGPPPALDVPASVPPGTQKEARHSSPPASPSAPVSKRSPGETAGPLGLQLAAFRSEERARRGWRELVEHHGDLLQGLDLAIRQVDLPGKGVFFRVFAQPIDPDRARSLCRTLEDLRTHCNIMSLE